jgi:protein-tyrosine phosphatase
MSCLCWIVPVFHPTFSSPSLIAHTACLTVHRYWPRHIYNPELKVGDAQLGDINVAVLEGFKQDGYVLSKLRLMRGNETRFIHHFWFDSWPDHGVPKNFVTVWSMLKAVRAFSNSADHPWVVHCSAGIGRTGSFIAIDHGIQHLHDKGEADVIEIVKQMRFHRGGMVQHAEQAEFVHQVRACVYVCVCVCVCVRVYLRVYVYMRVRVRVRTRVFLRLSVIAGLILFSILSTFVHFMCQVLTKYAESFGAKPGADGDMDNPVLAESIQKALACVPQDFGVHPSQVDTHEGAEVRPLCVCVCVCVRVCACRSEAFAVS